MPRSHHMRGCDVLGTDLVPGAGPQGMLLAIQVKDPKALATAQGGAMGALASSVVPGVVEGQIYSTMRDQLAGALKEKGVDATVTVLDAGQIAGAKPPSTSSDMKALGAGVVLGGGIVGIIFAIRAILTRKRNWS